MEGQAYHKSCFKCSHGGCPITPSNYAALEGILYCKHHFSQLFKEKGSYSHLIKSASIKRAATSVPESWMLVVPSIAFTIFFPNKKKEEEEKEEKMFWFVKQVFVCVAFFSPLLLIIVLLWLDPFLWYLLTYVWRANLVIYLSNAHLAMTNERVICKMYLSNSMMEPFIAFSTGCYFIFYIMIQF